MLTVADIREDVAPFAGESGKCPDSEVVLKYINQARRLLWSRGDWKGTVESIRVESFEGYLTLPYEYLRIKDAMICGGFVGIDTEWYELADQGRIDHSCYRELIDLGDKFATYRDYFVDNKPANHRLSTMAEENGDQGKRIVFNAIGEMGDRVSLVDEIGNDHEYRNLNPWIRHYRHAAKDATIGRVRIYIYDPNRGVRQCCAIYEPDDLNPQYRRYKTGSCRQRFYYCHCKKRYRPLLRESDPVEFNSDALIQAMIAINARRSREFDKYTAALLLAGDNLSTETRDAKHDGAERLRMSKGRRVENLNQMRYCPHHLE